MTGGDTHEPLDISRYIGVLWRRAWIILLTAFVCVGAVQVADARQTPVYASTARIRVSDPSSSSIFSDASSSGKSGAFLDTELQLMTAPDVKVEVKQQVGDSYHTVKEVTASQVADTEIVSIRVAGTSPETAAAAANAYAQVYTDSRQARLTKEFDERAAQLRASADELQTQIDELQAKVAANEAKSGEVAPQIADLVATRSDFLRRATEYDVEGASRTGSVEVVQKATTQPKPISPTEERDALIAGVVGLLLGIAIAFAIEWADDKIKSPTDAEVASGGLAVLGMIPTYAPNRRRSPRKMPKGNRSLVPLDSVHAEAYRALCTNLRFSAMNQDSKVFLVTSSSGSEGKSSITANLAVLLAEAGLSVAVISGDLRRPTIGKILNVDEGDLGLTSILTGEATYSEVAKPVILDTDSGRHFSFVPAGPLPANPTELLGGGSMKALLAELRTVGLDFILIDCPPVLPVADTLALAGAADGVLMISVLQMTHARSLAESCDRIRQIGGNLIGIVVNGIPLSSSRYSFGYYQYRATYYTRDPARATKQKRGSRELAEGHDGAGEQATTPS